MITLEQIKQEVHRLDPKLSEEDDTFWTAVMVLAALDIGQDRRLLADFTGLPLEFIEPRADRLEENGVWRDGETCDAGWFHAEFQEENILAFWSDVNLAERP